MADDMMEMFNDTVVLMDENDVEQEFEILDRIETDEARYIALMPIFEDPEEEVESSGELVIVRVELGDAGEEVYVTIDDDEEFEEIASIFEERLSEYYEIDHIDE